MRGRGFVAASPLFNLMTAAVTVFQCRAYCRGRRRALRGASARVLYLCDASRFLGLRHRSMHAAPVGNPFLAFNGRMAVKKR